MAPRLRRGVLVTLEGGEGSGKSALAESLSALLHDEGYSVRLTREPTGTALGYAVKGVLEQLAGASGAAVTAAAELFLFEAARAQHVGEVIRPALERGEVVLCDRFTDSTLAYQGYGRGLSLDHIRACNHIATEGLVPDLTLLLDVPAEVGLARASSRPGHEGEGALPDAIGNEPLDFHRRVREGFLALAQREPKRIVVLDASVPFADVGRLAQERVLGHLQHVL
ncbi:MAG TPA: dTMP kinase [Dehalococcoidia bacterium]|nr:dTMP kinase [Dehalococcoidia bacterium]